MLKNVVKLVRHNKRQTISFKILFLTLKTVITSYSKTEIKSILIHTDFVLTKNVLKFQYAQKAKMQKLLFLFCQLAVILSGVCCCFCFTTPLQNHKTAFACHGQCWAANLHWDSCIFTQTAEWCWHPIRGVHSSIPPGPLTEREERQSAGDVPLKKEIGSSLKDARQISVNKEKSVLSQMYYLGGKLCSHLSL